MERMLDRELTELKKKLLHMGALAEQMMHSAIQALVDRDSSGIDAILDQEHQVNLLQIQIDDLAIKALATQQPMAADLRYIITTLRINSELERIGDQAINICDNIEMLLAEPELKPLIDLPLMCKEAEQMLRSSLDSLVNRDVSLAQSVILSDDKVDALKEQIFRELLTYMIKDPSSARRAIALILVSRNLERIADHAVNIAEEVIYYVQGRDVRHPREAHPGPQEK
jgi:phosphate transport system protein